MELSLLITNNGERDVFPFLGIPTFIPSNFLFGWLTEFSGTRARVSQRAPDTRWKKKKKTWIINRKELSNQMKQAKEYKKKS